MYTENTVVTTVRSTAFRRKKNKTPPKGGTTNARMSKNLTLMIIAGEVSGDMHAAGLVKAIKKRLPDISCFGIGGDNMRTAGVEIIYDVKDMAVMGLVEVIRRLGFFRHVFNEMTAIARERKPEAVILVDYPGFNLRFAAKAHEMGIKIIYYICPQVWAWNRARIPKMAKIVDRLLTIFPFEQKYFEGTNLKVDFVGHPLVDEARKALNEPIPELPWQGEPRVALLPGSRAHEIDRILPVMLAAAKLIEMNHPTASFIIAAPTPEVEEIIRQKLTDLSNIQPSAFSPQPSAFPTIVTGNTRQVLRQAKAAMVASGTATIEAALMSCPMVIAYKMAGLTYLLCRMLVRVDNIGMVNIVAGKEICPEFIHRNATPQALAEAIDQLLIDSPERSLMIKELKNVSNALGPGGAEDRAADIVVGVKPRNNS